MACTILYTLYFTLYNICDSASTLLEAMLQHSVRIMHNFSAIDLVKRLQVAFMPHMHKHQG